MTRIDIRPRAGSRRARTAAAVAAVGIAATAAAVATSGSAGADARPAPDRDHACAGAWRIAVAEGPETLSAVATFTRDRTVQFGETSAIDSLTPGVPVEFPSPGAGAWAPQPDGSCRYHIVVLAADASGELTRTSDIRGTVLVRGRTFSGPLTITVTHPRTPGTVIRTTATGVRILP